MGHSSKRQVTKKPVARIVKQRPPAVKLYRRIAFSFIILTLLLLGLVAYLSFVKAHIKIYPAEEKISTNFKVDIVKVASAQNQIEGKIVEQIFEKTKEFTPAAEGSEVPAKAGGEVRIINKWNKDQPLVASTRLLAPDGKLYRIDNTVTVPAGGEVRVMAHADEEGEEYEIGPTRFTIPGLWSGLQDQIYAQSDSPMTGGSVILKIVSEADLTKAEKELAEEILEQAKAEIGRQNSDPRFGAAAYSHEVIEKISDTMPGEEADSFSIKIKIKAVAVFYNQNQMTEIMSAKLEEALDADHLVGKISSESTFAVGEYEIESGLASIDVFARAEAILKDSAKVLDKRKITGLSVEEAKLYLINSPAIEDVEISTRPFWINRIPNLEDHIEYEIIY